MPTLKAGAGGKRVVDEDTLAREIGFRAAFIRQAFIEQVGARPGESPVAAFSFGAGFGILRGTISSNSIPRTYVTPSVWKKAIGAPASKDGARARASQLLPRHAGKWTRVKDDGRAEAALIALWGAWKMGEHK